METAPGVVGDGDETCTSCLVGVGSPPARVLLPILRSERNSDRLYLNDAQSVAQTGSASVDQSHQSTRAGSGTCRPTNLLGDSCHHSLEKELHFTDHETEAPKCPKSPKRDGRHE